MQMRCATLLVAAVVFGFGTNLAQAAPAKGLPLPELKNGGPVGVGFVAGTTSGFSLEVWPVQPHSLVLHLGAAPSLNSLSVHLSYRVHLPAIVDPSGHVAVHLQLGPAFRSRVAFPAGKPFAELGGGVVIGAAMTVPGLPVEFFAEVQPTFAGSVSAPGTGLGLGVEGVGGVRLFLGGTRKELSSRSKRSEASEPAAEPSPVEETEEPAASDADPETAPEPAEPPQ